MKLLVTGGAGYIGSILCPMLTAKGHEVVLYDNFMWGVRPVLHFIGDPNIEIVAGDVRDKESLAKVIKKVDGVIHLAAIVGYPACAADPTLSETTNVDGTRNICDLVSKNQMFMFACTGSTYGQVEGVADEETPINPLTLYGRTKRDGEKMILEKDGVSMRFATVFGISPRLRLDLLVNDFCYQAYHNKQIIIFEGGHRRTFMHSTDSAAIYPFTIENYDKMRGNVYNIGSADMNYTKIDVAHMIQKELPFYLHEADVGEDPDKRDYEVCYKRITDLGFGTKVSLEQGVSEILKVVPFIKVRSEWRNA
ncbi:MAG: NAD-dependent epimerase/dehydratase family protein [Planctomycetota bacterium]|jgi:nucleoside-diphosphate-sugar epimerase